MTTSEVSFRLGITGIYEKCASTAEKAIEKVKTETLHADRSGEVNLALSYLAVRWTFD